MGHVDNSGVRHLVHAHHLGGRGWYEDIVLGHIGGDVLKQNFNIFQIS